MVISDGAMRVARFVLLALVSCGDAKTPSSAPLATTRLEVTVEQGGKPKLVTGGRAFAVFHASGPSRNHLEVFVFDGHAPEKTCTDMIVGGWVDDLGHGSAAIVSVVGFPQKAGKYPVASVAHVRGAGGKSVDMRSAPSSGAQLELTRYDELFEGTVSGGGKDGAASGTVSGIVCAAK